VIDAERTNTTVSVLTHLSAGAISVVRLAGPRALATTDAVFTPARSRRLDALSPQNLCFGRLTDDGEPLDDAVVAVPATEPDNGIVDINIHGGVRLVQRVVMLCERQGAVPADPSAVAAAVWPADSEVERETDALLPWAKTQRVAKWLARQREILPASLRSVGDQLAAGRTAEAAAALDAMVGRYCGARRLIDGVTVGLAGPVNAGKSTLANRLVGREQSIATALPGTTRDWVSGNLSLAGVPATLIDTAGVREPGEDLEREAIRRGLERVASADVVLWVIDASSGPPDLGAGPDALGIVRGHLITVMNKTDLGSAVRPDELPEAWREHVAGVSAIDGHGLGTLVEEIIRLLELERWADDVPAMLTARQHTLATDALSALAAGAHEAAASGLATLIGADRTGRPTA